MSEEKKDAVIKELCEMMTNLDKENKQLKIEIEKKQERKFIIPKDEMIFGLSVDIVNDEELTVEKEFLNYSSIANINSEYFALEGLERVFAVIGSFIRFCKDYNSITIHRVGSAVFFGEHKNIKKELDENGNWKEYHLENNLWVETK